MRLWRIAAVGATALAVAGCQTTGQGAQDLAAQIPTNYRAQIAAYLKQTLKDPYSVWDAEISEPTTLFGGDVPGVCVRMNAKNSFGGYVGIQTTSISFRDGVVRGTTEPVSEACSNVHWSPFPEMSGAS